MNERSATWTGLLAGGLALGVVAGSLWGAGASHGSAASVKQLSDRMVAVELAIKDLTRAQRDLDLLLENAEAHQRELDERLAAVLPQHREWLRLGDGGSLRWDLGDLGELWIQYLRIDERMQDGPDGPFVADRRPVVLVKTKSSEHEVALMPGAATRLKVPLGTERAFIRLSVELLERDEWGIPTAALLAVDRLP